ncbi:hypothetical protein L596_024389 [Steinernema carpocapsae]|uniref:Peptidase S1 domain-containing protein n=1 Tax=Steinernema carpocapsae TaxID=34508 RepID=A0A4U5MGL3_STECR|nr:hypothetical protein L596_024389 [Steinernema carpocapsae]
MRLLLQLLIASSFVSFAASAPAKGESGNDIIGGRPAQNGQWPWQVYLGIHKPSTGRTSLCGGSLISRRHIVTAAHCTLGVEAHNIRAMLGSVKQYDTTQNNPPRSTWTLRESSFTLSIPETTPPTETTFRSLRYLEADVEFNVNTQPIKIRKNDSALNYDGAYVYVTGWGRTSATSFVSPTLMETRIPFWSTDTALAVGRRSRTGKLSWTAPKFALDPTAVELLPATAADLWSSRAPTSIGTSSDSRRSEITPLPDSKTNSTTLVFIFASPSTATSSAVPRATWLSAGRFSL